MIATASAAATPDSPDVSVPSQPSGLFIGEKAGAVGESLRNDGHGIAGELGRMGHALQDRGRKVIAISHGSVKACSRLND